MTTPAKPALPERDTEVPAEQQGLFRKFDVRRTDGSSEAGGKHEHCEYFVLDVDHDPHAKAALAAYAAAVEATHPTLAADMRDRYGLDAAVAEARGVPVLTFAQADRIIGALDPCDGGHDEIAEFIRLLSERPATPSPTEPAMSAEQQPVGAGDGNTFVVAPSFVVSGGTPMPAERVALSDEHAKRLWADACDRGVVSMVAGQWLIRAVEAAHGITPSQGKGEQG